MGYIFEHSVTSDTHERTHIQKWRDEGLPTEVVEAHKPVLRAARQLQRIGWVKHHLHHRHTSMTFDLA